jgi:hypothetical protein
MLQTLGRLCGTHKPSRASTRRRCATARIDLTLRVAAAGRARIRKPERRRARWALSKDDAHNLGNHITRALDNHRIAHADILAGNLILIVQSGI